MVPLCFVKRQKIDLGAFTGKYINNILFSDKKNLSKKVSKESLAPEKNSLCMYFVMHAHKNKCEWLSPNQA